MRAETDAVLVNYKTYLISNNNFLSLDRSRGAFLLAITLERVILWRYSAFLDQLTTFVRGTNRSNCMWLLITRVFGLATLSISGEMVKDLVSVEWSDAPQG